MPDLEQIYEELNDILDYIGSMKNINNPSEYRVLLTIENMILHAQRDFDEND